MADLTRRQLMQGLFALGSCAGLGLLAACGSPEPTSGLGGQSVALTPVGSVTLPGTPGTPGYLPTPTAVPTSIGSVIIPDAPTDPYPRSDIRTPAFLPSPLPYSTPAPSAPLNIVVQAASDGNPRLPASLSPLIVIATVLEVRPARWTTRDGSRPANPHDRQNPYGIYTPVFVQVSQVVKGAVPSTRLALAVPGGVIGVDSIRYGDGLHNFEVGQQVVLFLKPRNTLPPVELEGLPTWHDNYSYTVTPTQQAVNSYQTLPLQELLNIIASVAGPSPIPNITPQRPSPVATPQRP